MISMDLSGLSPREYSDLTEKGISKAVLVDVAKELMQVTIKDFAGIAGISPRTLSRMKPETSLPEHPTEVTLSTIRVFDQALRVFGTHEKVQHWMKSPNSALSNRTPMELLENRFGTEEVFDILGRIEYGVYS